MTAGGVKQRIVVGAGFGGLGRSTLLSDDLTDEAEVTLIDRSTCSPGVFAVGDVATQETPRAGVFAFRVPSALLRAGKDELRASRRSRWFGRSAVVARPA